MVTLNKIQKELLETAKEKGFLTLQDFIKAYTSPLSRKQNIERFRALGYLKDTETIGKFTYIGDKNE